MQSSLKVGKGEKTIAFALIKHLWDRQVEAHLNFGAVIPKGISGPSLSFIFKNLNPYILSMGMAPGQGIDLSIERGIPNDGSSNLGYKLDL